MFGKVHRGATACRVPDENRSAARAHDQRTRHIRECHVQRTISERREWCVAHVCGSARTLALGFATALQHVRVAVELDPVTNKRTCTIDDTVFDVPLSYARVDPSPQDRVRTQRAAGVRVRAGRMLTAQAGAG
jgi:hypothetical protein